jgi:hypothetical protein
MWRTVGGEPLRVREKMERQIKEADWKIYRNVHADALERFSEQILLELKHINSDRAKGFHQRYLEIWGVLRKRDKEMALVFDFLRRSTALEQLAAMKRRGLVTEDEFLSFSQETQEFVNRVLSIFP